MINRPASTRVRFGAETTQLGTALGITKSGETAVIDDEDGLIHIVQEQLIETLPTPAQLKAKVKSDTRENLDRTWTYTSNEIKYAWGDILDRIRQAFVNIADNLKTVLANTRWAINFHVTTKSNIKLDLRAGLDEFYGR